MFNAIAVMSEKDILAIHGVVSNELKAQIEQSYPHLFEPEQFDFSDWQCEFNFSSSLPFAVGKGLVSEKDRFKSLVIKNGYRAEIETNYSGLQIIRFIRK
jgi:hypothetical protein